MRRALAAVGFCLASATLGVAQQGGLDIPDMSVRLDDEVREVAQTRVAAQSIGIKALPLVSALSDHEAMAFTRNVLEAGGCLGTDGYFKRSVLDGDAVQGLVFSRGVQLLLAEPEVLHELSFLLDQPDFVRRLAPPSTFMRPRTRNVDDLAQFMVENFEDIDLYQCRGTRGLRSVVF